MSELRVYTDTDSSAPVAVHTLGADIALALEPSGILFSRWSADRELGGDATQDDIIAVYRDSIDELTQRYGFKSVDVVSISPQHPDKDAMRNKFLSEHTHADYEVRFFVEGEGLFYIHVDGKVFAVRCTQGDLLSIPANMTHWFDMGPNPFFRCIRLFTTPEGWVANFTGSDIAQHYPALAN